MSSAATATDRQAHIRIDPTRCKGCGVCVLTCPQDCLALGAELNRMGYRHARFEQPGCTACGLCFFCCPEFGAITVYKPASLPS